MTTATTPLVLCLPRAEPHPDPESILLHVAPNGASPLDLKLVGTESSEVFTISIKHNQTSTFKAKNSKLSSQEWDAVLSTVLLGQAPDDADGQLLEGVEAITQVDEGKSLTVTIQKRIEGITQRLGQIPLAVTEDEELSLYDWCTQTLTTQTSLQDQITTLKSTLRAKDREIEKLTTALTELTSLKDKHESTLLEKFSLLLNEKKLKIREQQKLLAASSLDPAKTDEMDVDRQQPSTTAGPSRPRKRKARTKDVLAPAQSDSEDGFEKMDVEKPGAGGQASDEEEEDNGSDQADERTASETESDDDNDEDTPPVAPPTKSKTKAAAKRKDPSPQQPPSRRTRAQTAEVEENNTEKAEAPKTPPRRELPFATKAQPQSKAKEKTPPAGAGGGGSETESDDEL